MFRNHTQPTAIAVGTFVAPAHLESIARECGLIRRNTRKFSAQGLLLTLLKAISTGNASFSQMAASLGEIQTHSPSRQALHQRMNPKVIEFLQAVLRHVALSTVTESRPEGNNSFRRILLEDATQLRMHPKNYKAFRAVANNSGMTSGAKVDVIMDLMTGDLLRQKETRRTCSGSLSGAGTFAHGSRRRSCVT